MQIKHHHVDLSLAGFLVLFSQTISQYLFHNTRKSSKTGAEGGTNPTGSQIHPLTPDEEVITNLQTSLPCWSLLFFFFSAVSRRFLIWVSCKDRSACQSGWLTGWLKQLTNTQRRRARRNSTPMLWSNTLWVSTEWDFSHVIKCYCCFV